MGIVDLPPQSVSKFCLVLRGKAASDEWVARSVGHHLGPEKTGEWAFYLVVGCLPPHEVEGCG